MKYIILFTFFTGILSFTYAQNTFDVGTKWYYQEATNPALAANVLEITGDTIIAGQACSILNGDCSCGLVLTKYIYKTAGKIFFYNENTAAFSLLYDFTAMPGDTLLIDIPDVSPITQIIIDSLGQITQGGIVHQIQYFHGGLGWADYFIENIGANTCFFPLSPVCSPATGPIRCYINDVENIDYHFESPWFGIDFPCDTMLFLVGIEEPIMLENVLAYPNPFTDYAVIEVKEAWIGQQVRVQLQSILGETVWGKTMYIENVNGLLLKAGLAKLPVGQYLGRLNGKGFLAAFKLIKQ